MSQARATRPSGRPPQRRPRRTGGDQAQASKAEVPDLLRRRQKPEPGKANTKARAGRPPVLPFAIGLAVGWALAGPLPRLTGQALASLVQAPKGLAAMLSPIAHGDQRILVLGRDAVADNTDVMFTVQVKDGVTRLIQVPRDTYVEAGNLGVVKANSLLALAGMDTAKAEVARLVGGPVGRHVKVNLDGVVKLADALGGVEVDVPKRMYYVDNSQGLYIDLYPGPQLLKGKDLEGFLRFRHDELGDIGRMERQKLVFKELFRQLGQPSTLTRLPALLQIAGKDISTDLTPLEMTQLLGALAHTKLSTERLPGRPYWENDLSYWMPDSNTSHPTGNGEAPQ